MDSMVVTPNLADKAIWTGDNLYILRGMNSDSVDLISLDPPFNSKANYAAPIGSKVFGMNLCGATRPGDVRQDISRKNTTSDSGTQTPIGISFINPRG